MSRVLELEPEPGCTRREAERAAMRLALEQKADVGFMFANQPHVVRYEYLTENLLHVIELTASRMNVLYTELQGENELFILLLAAQKQS